MTHAKLVLLATSLWAGGVAATGALAYTLNRPLVGLAPTAVTASIPHAFLTPLVQPETVPEPNVIVLPTVEIVAQRAARVATPPPPHQRDISEMRCSAWRPLEQGSNSVQICD